MLAFQVYFIATFWLSFGLAKSNLNLEARLNALEKKLEIKDQEWSAKLAQELQSRDEKWYSKLQQQDQQWTKRLDNLRLEYDFKLETLKKEYSSGT